MYQASKLCCTCGISVKQKRELLPNNQVTYRKFFVRRKTCKSYCSQIGYQQGQAQSNEFVQLQSPAAVVTSPAINSPSSIGYATILLFLGAVASWFIQTFWSWIKMKHQRRKQAQLNDKTTIEDTDETYNSSNSSEYYEDTESVEWVNMAVRKIWRVYQRGLENWLMRLLQPVFDGLINKDKGPHWLQRLKIAEFTLDHEAPILSDVRRRTTRKDSEVNAVVDLRYTGGARMLLILKLGTGKKNSWSFKLPVLVSDLDLECQLWMKITLAPMCPWVGSMSFAFVSPPKLRVQLSPYNRVRLMRIPVLQTYLRQFLTVDLPQYMVLPRKLEVIIPPAVTAVAEAAVGREAVMRAVATAVLQADAVEQALKGALPLGRQAVAGGIALPEMFQGELKVTLRQGRNLQVWGLPWQTNPWCRLILGAQAVNSRKEDETSTEGKYGAPIWNQEFEFLVEDFDTQILEINLKDSPMTGKPEIGRVQFPLHHLPPSGEISVWLPVQSGYPSKQDGGELQLHIAYKPFQDELLSEEIISEEIYKSVLDEEIRDVKSLAAASSKAAVAASAAAAAFAVTRAAAARAAAKAAQVKTFASNTIQTDDIKQQQLQQAFDLQQQLQQQYAQQNLEEISQPQIMNLKQQQMQQLERHFTSEDGDYLGDGMAVSAVETPCLERYVDERPFRTNLVSNALDRKVVVRNTSIVSEDIEVLKSDLEFDSQDAQQQQQLVQQSRNSTDETQPIVPSSIQVNDSVTQQHKVKAEQDANIVDVKSFDSERKIFGLIPIPKRKIKKQEKTVEREEELSQGKVVRQAAGTVEEVIIPPDLPLEEIAREVARVREEAIQSEKTRAESFWAQALEQADRPWIILLVSLTAGALILLMVVFYRLDMLQNITGGI